LCKAIGDANSYADFAREANAVSTGESGKIEDRGINGSGMDFPHLFLCRSFPCLASKKFVPIGAIRV
jgi:hypothetical protein